MEKEKKDEAFRLLDEQNKKRQNKRRQSSLEILEFAKNKEKERRQEIWSIF